MPLVVPLLESFQGIPLSLWCLLHLVAKGCHHSHGRERRIRVDPCLHLKKLKNINDNIVSYILHVDSMIICDIFEGVAEISIFLNFMTDPLAFL